MILLIYRKPVRIRVIFMQSHKSTEPDIPKPVFGKAPYLAVFYVER